MEPPKLSVTPGRGDFSFQGTFFVPGTTVKVTSSFASLGGFVSGGPWTYTVADDGSFADDISVTYFQASGTLEVRAETEGWAALYTQTWSGPAGGIIAHVHLQHRAGAGEGVDHDADERPIAQAGDPGPSCGCWWRCKGDCPVRWSHRLLDVRPE